MCDAVGESGLFHEGDGITVQIREYLIGVTAAALVCGVVRAFVTEKGALGGIIRMLLGVLMLLVVIQPVSGLSVDELFHWTRDISSEAQSIVTHAESASKEELHGRIKQETRAYILSKAESLGAKLEVQVELSDDLLPKPIAVQITGAVSPYTKQSLTRMIEQDLGIDRGAQRWIG